MRWNGQAFDEIVLWAAVVGMFLLCVVGGQRGAAIELGMAETVEAAGAPMWQAVFTVGSWAAMALLLAAFFY